MFCPVCRYEYVEGIKECKDCNVPLVEELKPAEKIAPRPKLKLATLLAIIGISYHFIVTTISTIFPRIFFNLVLAQVNAVMFLLAMLTQVFFFVCFYKEFVHKEQKKLKTAALLVIINELVIALLIINGIVTVFSGVNLLLRYGVVFKLIDTIIPWVGAMVILYFFIVFYKEISGQELLKLKKPTFLAAIGSSIVLIINTLTVLNYFGFLIFGSSIDLSDKRIFLLFLLIGIPLTTFAVICLLIFFISFYKEQG